MKKEYIKKWFFIECIILFLAEFQTFSQDSSFKNSKDSFAFPVEKPVYLLGTFGEERIDHFHSGIDIKTNEETGKPIYAVNDGYISNIRISSTGYGKAIYIKHPGDLKSVYGHLDHFIPKIDSIVRFYQYDQKKFEINLTFDSLALPVSKGQLIAYSGNTGNSTGPHLHFEIRKSDSDIPINPLLFYQDIPDTIKPVVKSLNIYSFNKGYYLNNDKFNIKLFKKNTIYSISDTLPLPVYAAFGIGLETYDQINGTLNVCNIYSIRLYVDESLVYSCSFNEIPFEDASYVKSYMDYADMVLHNKDVHKLFVDPANHLKIYNNLINCGKIYLTDSNPHQVKILVEDIRKNESEVLFNVIKNPDLLRPDFSQVDSSLILPFENPDTFLNNQIKLEFADNTFYDTVYFHYHLYKPTFHAFSQVHQINNPGIPVNRNFFISIKTERLPDNLIKKAVIARLDSANNMTSIGGKYDSGFVSAYADQFGDYVVMVDTTPPKIISLSIDSDFCDMSLKKKIQLDIHDNLSGISSFTAYLDGKWVLFEYDKKSDLLEYTFGYAPSMKRLHQIYIKVIDKKQNEAVYEKLFYR